MNIKLFTKIGRLAIAVALSAIAVTIGATTTTQVQPAYSQASHCGSDQITIACATPGKDASTCVGIVGGDCLSGPEPPTPAQAGKFIGNIHRGCAQLGDTCTVTPP